LFDGNVIFRVGLALGKNNLVPGSDGAGRVEAVGYNVTAFCDVCSHLTCGLSEAELPRFEDIDAGLGQTVGGTLRQWGIFYETCLVRMPFNLTFSEAAALPCLGGSRKSYPTIQYW
jgi:NADPH:quinone reductase-like Zn-dependent oxidoreductase